MLGGFVLAAGGLLAFVVSSQVRARFYSHGAGLAVLAAGALAAGATAARVSRRQRLRGTSPRVLMSLCSGLLVGFAAISLIASAIAMALLLWFAHSHFVWWPDA
jgi:hypothetical protein